MTDENNPIQEENDLQEKLKQAQAEAEKKDQEETNSTQSDDVAGSEIEKLKADLEEMTNVAKRAMADMQNMKRRLDEEKYRIIFQANAKLITNLLPPLDTLQRALEHIPEGSEEWAKGISMSINQCENIFKESGLTQMECVGKAFNPDLHQALIQGPGEKDIIIEELEKGYMIGETVIRHAKVKVGNGEKE